ncbi:hypothetical protein [Aeromonas veronii]|uniref:hypothetical protein n=1 Tax=Aeromonas veronii TaxID=654 RepID=UPI0035B73649
MTEHTKGLLATFEVGDNGNLAIGSEDKTSLLTIVDEDGIDFAALYHAADARRIVACWNLLDGYPTEALEGVTLAEFVAKQAFISQFDANDGVNLSISGVAVQLLAASFAGQFKASGATNYLEMSGNHPETGPFTITMQRKHGLTPVEKLEAVTKQRDVLLDAMYAVQSVMNSSEGVAGWHKNGDIASWDKVLPEVADALEFVEGEQS